MNLKSGISVLLPVKNARDTLAAALISVCSQTRQPDEVLIVDDGCTDGSMEIVRKYWSSNFRIVTGPQRGLAAALQEGLSECQYDLVARMDADDTCKASRLELQEIALRNEPQLWACASRATIFGGPADGQLLRTPLSPIDLDLTLRFYNPLVHSSMMFRRDAVQQVGGYRAPEGVPYPEDYDLWLRIARIGRIRALRDPLVAYRVHADSISQQHGSVLARRTYDVAFASAQEILPRPELVDEASAVLKWIHEGSAPPANAIERISTLTDVVRAFRTVSPHKGPLSIEMRLKLASLAWRFALARSTPP